MSIFFILNKYYDKNDDREAAMKKTFRHLYYGILLVCTAASGCGESTLDTNDGDTESNIVVLQTDDGLADNTVTDIAVDYVFNGIWIGTLNGISFYSKTDSTIYTYGAEYTGIPDMQITSLLVDNSGTVWAGTEKGAAYMTPADSLWNNISELLGWYVADIAAANDYSIFFATRNGLKVKSVQDEWTAIYDEEAPSIDITSVTIGNTGLVWAGTMNGISVLNRGTGDWTQYGDSVLPNVNINVVYQDASGFMWCGSASNASRYDGTNWTHYGEADGLAAFGINDFAEDNYGILWAATDTGVYFKSGSRWYPFTLPDKVAGAIVNTIEVDRMTGNLWIGTSTGIVQVLNIIE